MNYCSLGKRIREERLKLGLTQEKLSEEIGVTDAYIGKIERGERSLSLETLVRIANKLGVTVDYLLEDSVNVEDKGLSNELIQVFHNRSCDEKRMALDIIKLMFNHIDKLKK